MALERGSYLNNRYRIVEILGQGGMGSVYRAIDENLGVEVAVKDNLFTTDEYARQFRREASILASLRHPNLPRVTDHFVVEGQGQYLVMDYIDGEDLRQRMDRVGLILEEDAITIGAAICDALSYLASCNPPVVHRDIKPGNVKITPQGQIYLVDFGLAKIMMGSQATTSGARAMTPGYSPPEQYGTARTDQRTDIYSLGATLYAAVTGAIPEDALARAMDQTQLTPVRKLNPRISKRFAAAIEQSLEIRPDDRFKDAEKFKEALLNSSSTVRRASGEYFISPPPDAFDHSLEVDEKGEPLGLAKPNRDGQLGRIPSPVVINAPATDPKKSRPRSKPRRRNRPVLRYILVLALLAVAVTAAYIYFFDPALPTRALTMYGLPAVNLPFQAVSTETSTPTSAPTFTPPPLVAPVNVITPTASNLNLLDNTPTQEATATSTQTASPTATFTPVPTLMGGGRGEIAFASDATGTIQLYLVGVDGTNLRQLTDLEEGACQPDWSPGGNRLVFISPCPGNRESYPGAALFILEMDTGTIQALPTAPGGDFDPDWSPDGSKILFTSVRKGGRPQIHAYDFETNSVYMVSDPETYSLDFQPAWSPDGNRITFVTNRKGPYQIWFMDKDGKNQELFSRTADLVNMFPRWSPDGQVIMFTQSQAPGRIPMVVLSSLDEEGLHNQRVTSSLTPMREASFSPDGIWIAYEGWPEGQNHDIYIITTNGSGRVRLTTDPRLDFDPVWRPQSPP